MPRKIFISFLGTNNYVPCNYFTEGHESEKVLNMKYIQEAAIKLYCNDFTETDNFYIFLTKDAREKNWQDNGHKDFKTKEFIPNEGLDTRLRKLQLKGKVIHENIDEGFSTDQIWKIFNTVYKSILPNDEVILDITHAFRSLPMLGMVLLNYAKALKNVSVKSIHYGAFEKLGTGLEVEKMPIEDRNASILNLVSFSELQDWTKAADIFIKYGNSQGLVDLAKKEIQPLLKEQNDNTLIAKEFNKLAKSLDAVTNSLNTNRGSEIVSGKIFKNLNDNINTLSNDNFIVPMKPILEKISEKIKNFSKNPDWKNGFEAVQWCIEHDLTQQGITMLQESIFTYFCHIHNLDFKKEKDRELISACFYIKKSGFDDELGKWKELAKNNESKVKEILNTLSKELTSDYESLTTGRNDIQHGGFSKNESPSNLKTKLKYSFEKIKGHLNLNSLPP